MNTAERMQILEELSARAGNATDEASLSPVQAARLKRRLRSISERQLDELLFGIKLIMAGATAEEAIAALQEQERLA